ncbi:MAG: nuclear transport factor 2 family protein [bacterium]|nr:nuclear transport factor 2 family protein [bacterium]
MGASGDYRTLAARYARAVDTGDSDGFATLFLPDAVVRIKNPGDIEPSVEIKGRDRLRKIPATLGVRYSAVFHFLGQAIYDQVSDDEVRSTVYCSAHHLDRAKGTNHIMRIVYLDRCLRDADGEWRFAERSLDKLWTETNPVDALPEEGAST